MYDTSVVTGQDARLSLEAGGAVTTVDLYSQQGLEMVASLWTKLSTEYRLMYELSWLGVPVIQLPGDIVMMQELIWKLRPDFIIECGFAHGGSAVLYASLCELAGKGEVIGIDVEVRKYNRVAVQSHPVSKRIRIVERSSVDSGTVAEIRRMTAGAGCVMVVLDSNHRREHVLREMELYHELVTADSYLVVMDGAQAHVWDIPSGKREWRESNPLQAIEEFLAAHPEFEQDSYYTRTHVTGCPRGFLRRRRAGGAA
jgi:cephalosporin hydroxylase